MSLILLLNIPRILENNNNKCSRSLYKQYRKNNQPEPIVDIYNVKKIIITRNHKHHRSDRNKQIKRYEYDHKYLPSLDIISRGPNVKELSRSILILNKGLYVSELVYSRNVIRGPIFLILQVFSHPSLKQLLNYFDTP
jgi:hypothetical protein